ncbi:hypothetical protein [Novosphingobium sp.]|uniref:hypothetical protein n=1 Tax=Novosphingobium sp. TaxID=1874826 RepID=UPI00333E99EB
MEFSLITPDQTTVPADDTMVEPRSRYAAPRRSRFASALMALGMVVLMVLALLSMAVLRDEGHAGGTVMSAMNLSPPPGEKQPNPTKARAAAKPATVSHQVQSTAAPKLPPRVPIDNPNKVEWPEGFVHTSHAEMAAADIGKIHSAASTGNADASAGGGGKGGGEGPGGSHLYNAAWYREPPNSALASYMRPGQASGRWAEIACRTVENWHVEQCQELGEEPRGSGMARVLRQAAWQFLVRPPRVDGKSLIGTWVRIHYDFVQKKVEETPEQP